MAMTEDGPRVCSMADALDVVGEKWSLLVVREVFYGVRRFEGIARNTGAPRDVLTARLRKLSEAGVLRRVQYSERPARSEYHLTEAGADLAPVLLCLLQWGRRWTRDAPAAPTGLTHDCGEPLHAQLTCRACGRPVVGGDLSVGGRPLGPPPDTR